MLTTKLLLLVWKLLYSPIAFKYIALTKILL